MKHWILAFVLASLCSQVGAAEYSMDFIAQHLAKRDQEKGLPNDQHRVDEIKYMLGETADQCQRTSGNEPAYMGIADKIMMSRNLLGEKGIEVSMYDLLDVLKSTLGDGGGRLGLCSCAVCLCI
ncbi:hypothetical protein [Pseudomonas pseudonitroreducens]|uniref:hypothetical protein n=1 Tax=Pseudomonas pseudonitroreducens TaxID=2892326 RepID=UPI001F47D76B|nr:hypothetical protein [Pseudomonas pseudonitroreducens]